jgi:hypothetical protein
VNKKRVLEILSCKREEIALRFHVRSLSIFGSVARDEVHSGSDVDILVEYEQTPGIFGFLRLKMFLENILGGPVDLVTVNALKRQLEDQILKERILVS